MKKLVPCIFALALFTQMSTAKPFRFVVYGDSRDGHEVHRKIVKLIMEQKPQLVLQTGDLVHSSKPELWKIYDDITGDMRKHTRFYAARGNHDIGEKQFDSRQTSPINPGSNSKLYYSLDYENCHFITLALDTVTPYDKDSLQYQWLVKDLSQATKRAKHIIVMFHVPPYSIGAHGSDLNVRRILCPVFKKYGVRVAFGGHDHNYYHTTRDGITYIVTGGGGAPLYPCNKERGVIDGDKYLSCHHFLVCDVNGDSIRIQVIKVDGTELEHFSISAKKR